MALTNEQIKQGYSTIKGNYDPLTGNVITPASLQPQPTVEIPPAQPDTTNYGGITGGVYDSIQNEYNTYKTATENAQKAQVAGGSDILSIMNEITGKTGYSQNANEIAGVNKATEDQNKYGTQLADLNAQATSLNREAQAIPIQVQQDFANTGATDRGVAPITTGKLRENALRALSIAQQSDIASAALTGSQIRLQAAKDKAQQIVDLKFKPLEDTLAIKQKQYSLNKDLLENYDAKRAEALKISLAKETKDLEEAKAKAKAIEDMIVTATPNAPANIISNAKAIKDKGGSALEVAQALGKYGGDYLKTELLKQQIETEKAQRVNIYANKAKTDAETALLGTTGGGKPPTAAQSTAAGYASRIVQSKDIIDTNTDKLSKLSIASYLAQRKLPNMLQSPLVQQQLQAERNFVNAVLRRESGAAIAQSEFDSATKQYFPMPGDSAEVLAQKKANRDLSSRNIINEAGSAYEAPPVAVDNKFGQAIGIQAPTNYSTTGMSILSDGSFNFTLPTNQPTK